MKNLIKFLMVAFIAFSMTSCSKDELPSPCDNIYGEYKLIATEIMTGPDQFERTWLDESDIITYNFQPGSVSINDNGVTHEIKTAFDPQIGLFCDGNDLKFSGAYGNTTFNIKVGLNKPQLINGELKILCPYLTNEAPNRKTTYAILVKI